MKKNNIFRFTALMLVTLLLFLSASCSSDGKAKASYDVLGMDYSAYEKEYSAKRYVTTSETLFNAFYVKPADDVTYYYGSDSILLGVKEGKIVFYGYLTSSVFTVTSFPTVNDVLSVEGLSALCKTAPEITEIQANMPFAVWEINNGYVGIGSVGSTDYEGVYSNMASVFVVFADQSLCSLY